MSALLEDGFTIDTVEALDCTLAPEPWSFAQEFGDAIDRHWHDQVLERPALFNGIVLMQTRGAIERRSDGSAVFRAAYAEVEFKSFLAWRDLGYPVRGFRNGFGMAALLASDGAFVLGEMGPETANAGRVYFPSGTPDRSDIVGDTVDIEGSIRRELAEETGLDLRELAFARPTTVIQDGVRVCFMKQVRAPLAAAPLVARIEAAIAREAQPELVRMHIVRSPADITAAMPPFVAAYLRRAFDAH